jgi:hypothetical protein
VTVFLDFERRRPIALYGVAQTVQGTHAGIAAPGENQFFAQPAPMSWS